ncbi:MAG: hypothetical protein LC777_16765, partial [Actinobacteria bacterium]|nr:hypothetical protein [Actinomycetota bacterium]
MDPDAAARTHAIATNDSTNAVRRFRPTTQSTPRSKGAAEGSVPVGGELMRLWSDYMHEEYG